ncbi:MAG: tetratricopeptide repeat protein [candidate division NC10 bacterium]
MWPTSKTLDWYADWRHSFVARLRRFTGLVVGNWKIAAGLAIGVIVIVALVAGYFVWGSRQEADASDLLFRATRELGSSTRTAEDAARQEEGVRLLRELATRYSRTAAAAEATLRLGTLYYTVGEYDEARNVYQTYLKKNPRGRVAFAAGMGIGDTYLSQGKYDKAMESYSQLIDRFPKEPLLPEAFLNLAATYLKINREQEAIRLYQKVTEGYPNSGWDQTARARLRKRVRR